MLRRGVDVSAYSAFITVYIYPPLDGIQRVLKSHRIYVICSVQYVCTQAVECNRQNLPFDRTSGFKKGQKEDQQV